MKGAGRRWMEEGIEVHVCEISETVAKCFISQVERGSDTWKHYVANTYNLSPRPASDEILSAHLNMHARDPSDGTSSIQLMLRIARGHHILAEALLRGDTLEQSEEYIYLIGAEGRQRIKRSSLPQRDWRWQIAPLTTTP
jgi:hypothetical protein